MLLVLILGSCFLILKKENSETFHHHNNNRPDIGIGEGAEKRLQF